jgi:hypothetical protein
MRVLLVMKWQISWLKLIRPEPACGISIGVAKEAVRDWMSRKHQEY